MVAVVNDIASAKPSPFGLLSSATDLIEDSSVRWTDDLDYPTTDCAALVTLHSMCNTSEAVTAIEPSGSALFRKYIPFEILTTFKCSTMGMRPEEIEERARDAAASCVQKALEFEFWTGSLAKVAAEDWDAVNDGAFPNRFLASTSAVDVTPTPGTGVRPKHGLALLEQALADCGCGSQGTIHATRGVSSVLGYKGENDRITTPIGNYVVAGSGYTGVGPDGTDPGAEKAWMYATGPVTVRLGDIMVVPEKSSQSVNIQNNEITYTVSQPAAVTWNTCCHAAVLVDLALEYS